MAADMRRNLGVSALYKLILLQYSQTIREARRVTTPFESTKLEGAVPTGKPYFSLLHPGAEIPNVIAYVRKRYAVQYEYDSF